MEILAWNCRGIDNSTAVQALRLVIQQKKPAFVFLSETKVHDKDYMQNLRLELGMFNCEAVFSAGQFGGLALFWIDGLDMRLCSKSTYHIDVEVWASDGSGIQWRLTGFYGHPTTSERHRTCSLLRQLSNECSLPWAVINEILHTEENEGGGIRREGQMQAFRDAISYSDLFDLGFLGELFTWRGAGVRSRLDRAVASASWFDVFPVAPLCHLEPIHGDHIPILLGVYQSSPSFPPRNKHRFLFESYWTLHEECEEVVKAGWSHAYAGGPMFQATKKIMSTRFSLNKWQRVTFGNRGREIAGVRARLQQLGCLPLTLEYQEECVVLSCRLERWLTEEHAYWKQHSKVTWLVDVDRNTKYFHRKASNRRAKNRLQGLFDNDGVWQNTKEGMTRVVLDYFSSMYTAETIDYNHMQSVVDLIQPKVTPDMNATLCAPYTAS